MLCFLRPGSRAVQIIKPELVIPVSLELPGSVYRNYNHANTVNFKRDVEKPGIDRVVLPIGDSVGLRDG